MKAHRRPPEHIPAICVLLQNTHTHTQTVARSPLLHKHCPDALPLQVASLESLRGQPCVVPLLEYGVTSCISGVRQWVLVFPRYQGSLREWRLNWAGRGLNTQELPVYLSLFLQVGRVGAGRGGREEGHGTRAVDGWRREVGCLLDGRCEACTCEEVYADVACRRE